MLILSFIITAVITVMDLMDAHSFYLPFSGQQLHAVLENVKLTVMVHTVSMNGRELLLLRNFLFKFNISL